MNDTVMLAKQLTEIIQIDPAIQANLRGPISESVIRQAERKLGTRLPQSYRVFLRLFGGGRVYGFKFLGLRDEPAQSQSEVSHSCVLLALAGRGREYFLDLSCPNASGECPIVVFGPDEERMVVAESFLHLLRMVMNCENDESAANETAIHCGECDQMDKEEECLADLPYSAVAKELGRSERSTLQGMGAVHRSMTATSRLCGVANGIENVMPPRKTEMYWVRQGPPCSED